MPPERHEHGGEGELVDAVLLDGEPARGGVHPPGEDGALVVVDAGLRPVGRGTVAGERRRGLWGQKTSSTTIFS